MFRFKSDKHLLTLFAPSIYLYIGRLFYKIKSFSNKPKKMVAYDFIILIFICVIAIGAISIALDHRNNDKQ